MGVRTLMTTFWVLLVIKLLRHFIILDEIFEIHFFIQFLGRSVSGANRPQSVSVVASTSSEAIIPELDFVFKKPPITEAKNQAMGEGGNRHSTNAVPLPDHFSETNAQQTHKFDEAITAIMDENGAIHLNDKEGSALLRIVAPLSKKMFDDKNSLPGTAASNRKTASQQVLATKNGLREGLLVEDKLHFQTSQNNGPREVAETQSPETLNIKTMKTGAGTILVFNRTQLITVATDTNDGNAPNTSSTFILIDHQLPSTTAVQDDRESLLSEYEQLKLNHRLVNRPRQVCVCV